MTTWGGARSSPRRPRPEVMPFLIDQPPPLSPWAQRRPDTHGDSPSLSGA